ncbi:ABC transporter permease [Actinomadura rugatobispora]|uniref:ABC transporter permease n=1 Tax=Actinomadura rugatobispora TaxID=1994 RepID=A0ABW0ZNC0_9ACTN|nr:ABC transporter permease [Actinomadura rugatobispora]
MTSARTSTPPVAPAKAPGTAAARPWAPLGNVNVQASLLGVAILAGALLLWYLAAERAWVSPLLIAPPQDVFAALGDMVASGALWPNVYATAYETLAGLAVAAVLAFVLAVVFTFSEPVHKAVYPYLVVIQTFPKVAIAPMVIAGFGYGLAPKAFLAALLAFFPLLVNAMVGLASVGEDQHNLFRSVRAGRWQILFKLRIPHAVSYILPALNTAAVLALIGAIVAEFVSAREGLGFAIQAATQNGAIAATYALLIVMGFFGIAIWLSMAVLNRLLARYRA